MTKEEAMEFLDECAETVRESWCDDSRVCNEAYLKFKKAVALLSGESCGFRPIETAPEEGQFLVYMPDDSQPIQAANWHKNIKVIGNQFAFDMENPTHWMPMPITPAKDALGNDTHECCGQCHTGDKS